MRDEGIVWIFDTTLRDGEQSPGATMNVEEKVLMARQLERLGVNVIEAGFAASSPGDFEAIQRVAQAITEPVVLSLARTKESDIKKAIKAVEGAKHPGVHVFIATSQIHMEQKLRMLPAQVLEEVSWAVALARQYTDHVEFSAEDASRSDREFLLAVFGQAIAAGAAVCNVPDTTGYADPEEFGNLVHFLIRYTPGAYKVRWSAHCHNDLGNAIANSLAAVKNGARQVECTVNGIGERAGNASLEEIVMNIIMRPDCYPGIRTSVDTTQLYPASRLLSHITGLPIPINKPIVGDNAFAHEAGIHQDGVLKDKRTYEIMRPEDVGRDGNRLVLGKHSGRHAFAERLKKLGLDLTNVDMNAAFEHFKALADIKKCIYDEDIIAIVTEEATSSVTATYYEVMRVNAQTDTFDSPRASVTVRVGKEIMTSQEEGDGIVDACYRALGKAVGLVDPKLSRYSVQSITGGTDALGAVSCELSVDGVTASGSGSHTDIVIASALAYIAALNKIRARKIFAQQAQQNGTP